MNQEVPEVDSVWGVCLHIKKQANLSNKQFVWTVFQTYGSYLVFEIKNLFKKK